MPHNILSYVRMRVYFLCDKTVIENGIQDNESHEIGCTGLYKGKLACVIIFLGKLFTVNRQYSQLLFAENKTMVARCVCDIIATCL